MVLDDGPAIEGFSDDAPDSDSDRYSLSESSSSAIVIDSSKFPRPFPILGPLFGYNSQLISKLVHKRIERSVKLLGRPMTDDEATAIAYWTAKGIAVASWGPPLGIAGGAWRAYTTSDTFRFPFYKPDPHKFRADTWPTARGSFISGSRAVVAWHATRLLAYGLVGGFFGRLLLASYAMSVSVVGEIADPRLKNYLEAIRSVAQRSLPNEAQTPRKGGVLQGKDVATMRRVHSREIGDSGKLDNEEEYGDTKSSETPAIFDDAILPDPNKTSRERVTRTSRETYSSNSNTTRSQLDKQPNNFAENPDDGLQTSPERMDDAVTTGGSAWERIRQQASSQPAGTRGLDRPAGKPQDGPRYDRRGLRRDRQPQPREGPAYGDSISYSKSDEERQLARDEAQKDFDARVEQERRGGDFSAVNGEQRRW